MKTILLAWKWATAKHAVAPLAAMVALGWSAVAFAAGFPLVASTVGEGSAAVAHCDPDGFTISYTTSRGNVTQATVGGIKEPNCAGGSLQLVLTDSSGANIGGGGPAAVPTMADPGAMTLSLSVQPYAGSVAGYRVVISGP